MFLSRSVKSSAASLSLPLALFPNAMTSTLQPRARFKCSTSGMKSPSPLTRTIVSSRGASSIASIAMPMSQSPFFAPPANICRSFALTSKPMWLSASKNFSLLTSSVRITYASARTRVRPFTASSSMLLKFTCALYS